MRIDLAGHIDAGGIVHAPVVAGQPAGRHHEGRAAQVADILDGFAGSQTVRQVDQRPFGIAENQQIGLGIGQDGTADLVRPVIVMGDAAQRRFDAADDHRHVGIRFARALGVHGDGAVRAFIRFGIRRVGVVGADLAVGRVLVDHGIHVAGRNAVVQTRLAEDAEGVGRQPVRLADDANAVTLRFKQAADEGHAETRMVDVGVARDEDDVALVPAQRVHLGTRHRQERRHGRAGRPLGTGRK